ncbi:MAG: GNAT family N-acetyltransferase [Actinomycetota bacterium]
MRRQLDHGYEVDDDPARVDLEVAHAFLTGSYWASGRTLQTVERLVAAAARVVGVYRDGEMVGFCRVESDEVTFAFLLDVFVLPEHRKRGLGVELVREAVELGPHADLRWHLGTRDAHSLYERFGFGPPDTDRQMFRPGLGRA